MARRGKDSREKQSDDLLRHRRGKQRRGMAKRSTAGKAALSEGSVVICNGMAQRSVAVAKAKHSSDLIRDEPGAKQWHSKDLNRKGKGEH
nr:hypothetical protein [Clostridia bacterium]